MELNLIAKHLWIASAVGDGNAWPVGARQSAQLCPRLQTSIFSAISRASSTSTPR